MLFSDISQIKKLLEIDSCEKEEDVRLLFYAEWASKWIEERLNRPDMGYQQRTEYYDGRGTQKLLLRSRPVYADPVIMVFEDLFGNFGSTSGAFDSGVTLLTYGTDFCLQIDQKDGTSRSGILFRINGLWPLIRRRQGGYLSPYFDKAIGAIKVVYYAGYTVDNCPSMLRMACSTLIAKMRGFFPLGLEVGSEHYKDRSLSYLLSNKDYLLSTVEGMLAGYHSWIW